VPHISAAASLNAALAGRYEVEREIGAGGMATVYLAHDRKHARKVAIKVLHAELAAALGAERFLHEIKVTANLQHPHILGLIDSGLIGDDAGALAGRPYYVMPFVEGQSLRQRLKQEQQLPLADAVRIATEVAGAIDYAHRRGVIHRDIKPENILLHDGSAIVADFGIALAVTEAGGSRMTQTGLSLGTPSYMSPEQAMGERVITAKSDIYALGAVCYEMLSGEPPFTGPTVQAILARVMNEEPRSLSGQRRSVPSHVAAAVSQALEKVPADRFATAHDFAEALKNPAFTLSTAASTGTRRDERHRPALYAVTTLAILMAVAAAWGWMRPAPPQQVVRSLLAFDSTEALVPGGSWTTRLALSPDGSRLAHIGGRPSKLFVRERDQLEGTVVQGSEGGFSPFFSPDGKHIGLMRELNLQITSVAGGPPTLVTDQLVGLAGASWGPDGFIIADASGNAPLVRVEAKRGAEPAWFTVLDTAAGEFDHLWPDVLPNGKGVLFSNATIRPDNKGLRSFSIAVAAIPSGEHRVLLHDAVHARYASSGHLVYVTTNRTLMAVPFDQGSMQLTGEPIAVAEGMRLGMLGSADLSVSANGAMLYGRDGGRGTFGIAWVNRDGRSQLIDSAWSGVFSNPTISPDGSRLAINALGEGGNFVWIKPLDKRPAVRLTYPMTDNARRQQIDHDLPAWTPDGRSVTFSSNEMGYSELWTQRADGGTKAALQLRQKNMHVGGAAWSPDGKWLIFQRGTGNGDIAAIRPGIDTVPTILLKSKFAEANPALSPNGRWLAYQCDESGRPEVYVVPFPNTADAKWVITTQGGTVPVWSRNGNELFYRDAQGNIVAVQVHTGAEFSRGSSTKLFAVAVTTSNADDGTDPALLAHGLAPQYSVSPDAHRFLMIQQLTPRAPDKLIVVDNWLEELRSKTRLARR
jgi:tRNA A-37 threonylcarbamoyl transferase component Bud32